jgi:hypothetical protein
MKIIPNHGEQRKVIGVIIFIVNLVPTHLLGLLLTVERHGRASHLARESRITLVCVLNNSFCLKIAMCWPAGEFPFLCVVLKHEGTFVYPMGARMQTVMRPVGWWQPFLMLLPCLCLFPPSLQSTPSPLS